MQAREVVLAVPGATEHDHFGRPAYRITPARGKPSKIFMTLWPEDQRAVLMLSTEQQAELHAENPHVFFPVPNKWGAKGATFVDLLQASLAQFHKALSLAMANSGAKGTE